MFFPFALFCFAAVKTGVNDVSSGCAMGQHLHDVQGIACSVLCKCRCTSRG